VSSARRALAFLTPLGGAAVPSPSALGWFPVIGAALGAFLGLVWWGAHQLWPPAVAAGLVVAADLAITGMLHIDGLMDAADGLLPHLSRERRLEVLADPKVGAFGLAAGGTALLLRWAALFSMRPSVLLLVGLWAASRAFMAVTVSTVPYARAGSGGLASAFLQGDTARPGVAAGIIGTALAGGAVALWHPLAGLVALAAGIGAAVLVVLFAVRRIGGFTGDVLGAAGVVLETVGLVVAAAKW